jgi:hypothetical protein
MPDNQDLDEHDRLQQFTSHYQRLQTAMEALPNLIHDRETRLATWHEITVHIRAIEELYPPSTDPLSPHDI